MKYTKKKINKRRNYRRKKGGQSSRRKSDTETKKSTLSARSKSDTQTIESSRSRSDSVTKKSTLSARSKSDSETKKSTLSARSKHDTETKKSRSSAKKKKSESDDKKNLEEFENDYNILLRDFQTNPFEINNTSLSSLNAFIEKYNNGIFSSKKLRELEIVEINRKILDELIILERSINKLNTSDNLEQIQKYSTKYKKLSEINGNEIFASIKSYRDGIGVKLYGISQLARDQTISK